jgi:hypothetical protein
MQDSHADRAHRAAARGQLPVAVLTRDAAEEQDRLTPIPVAERLAAVWQVSVAAWAFAGRPVERLRRDVVHITQRSPTAPHCSDDTGSPHPLAD